VFADGDFEVGDVIGPAMTLGDEDDWGSKMWNLTPLARNCNHQENNNVIVEKSESPYGSAFDLVAAKPISQDDELVSDYKQVTQAIGPHSRMQWEGKDVPSTNFEDYVEQESDEEA